MGVPARWGRGLSRCRYAVLLRIFFFQAEDGIRDTSVTGVQTCALPISREVQRTRSDDDGRFSIDLAPGTYRIQITLAGFVTVERRVVIEESHQAVLDVKLELAETRSEVNVRGKAEGMANSDPNYRALRDGQPKETFAVSNLALK